MSEYQYYEFRAVGRPLTQEEMDKLRACSSRAEITATSFANEYSFGDFKGNEDRWMELYFDAFVYLANWGTRKFKVRIPSVFLPAAVIKPYTQMDALQVEHKNGKTIIAFAVDGEGDGDWVEGEGWLDSLIPIRDELMSGDLRALYLGWLQSIQFRGSDDSALEPPIPPNLSALSPSLEKLAEFLCLDEDLLAVAAEASTRQTLPAQDRTKVEKWIEGLALKERNGLLARLLQEDGSKIQCELRTRYRQDSLALRPSQPSSPPRRTVGELLSAVEAHAETRRQEDAKKATEKRTREERAAAMARSRHLDRLAGQEPGVWQQVEDLISTRQPKNYDQALKHLIDLRDLALRNSGDSEFRRRLEELQGRHAAKSSLIGRIRKAGL